MLIGWTEWIFFGDTERYGKTDIFQKKTSGLNYIGARVNHSATTDFNSLTTDDDLTTADINITTYQFKIKAYQSTAPNTNQSTGTDNSTVARLI